MQKKSAFLPGLLFLICGIIFIISAALWLFYYPDGSTQLLCALGDQGDCQQIIQISAIHGFSVYAAIVSGFLAFVFGIIFLSEHKSP